MNKDDLLKIVRSEKGSISKTKLLNTLKNLNLYDLVMSVGPTDNIHECFFWWFYNLSSYPKQCVVCNNKITTFSNFNNHYSLHDTCSKRCAALNPKRKEKTKNTLIDRYGVSHQMQIKEVKDKIEATCVSKYGVSNALKLPSVKEGLKNKFGNVENISQTDYWKNKMKTKSFVFQNEESSKEAIETLKKELGVEGDYSYQQLAAWKRDGKTLDQRFKDHGFLLLDYSYKNNEFSAVHLSCDTKNTTNIQKSFRCLTCHPIKYSLFECEMHDFLSSLNIQQIERNTRKIIAPLELDFYFPEYNLAIECNGDYWHSYNRLETSEEKKKHLVKLEECNRLGIDLIQITEHEWNERKDIVKSILKVKFGKANKLYARKLICKEITTKEAAKFCNENHIQKTAPASIAVGIFNNEELVGCATIAPSRYRKKENDRWELIRCSFLKDTVVIGGFNKLMSFLKIKMQEQGIYKLESYVDRRLFSGKSLENNNWKLSHISPPGYCWLIYGEKWSRTKSQKHKLKNLLPNFNEDLSEAENMFSHGATRLWDCGQLLFLLDL